MNGWLPLYAALATAVIVALRGDLIVSIVGIPAAVMFLCTSMIVFAIEDDRRRGGSS